MWKNNRNTVLFMALICVSSIAKADECAIVKNDKLSKPVRCHVTTDSISSDISRTIIKRGRIKYIYDEKSVFDKTTNESKTIYKKLQGLNAEFYQRDANGLRGNSIPSDTGYYCYKQITGSLDICTNIESAVKDAED